MKIAVYCGSSAGNHDHYREATQQLGQYLANNNIDIVYGGGKVGLMGEIANAALQAGGKVYGVIPEYLQSREIAHTGLTELQVVADMHERKATMAEMADAFVALPGGAGTLEEIFEAWTWAQLGHHQKPCAFYNIGGFYDSLLVMINHMVDQGFLNRDYATMLINDHNPEALIAAINRYQAPMKKWQ